ncbi:hypothetical protein AB833_16105 [Chromatiales bacterium (ex Bugula neritina AB1)]|nr:hypothetical protein AB833_16105 [Chromatiales bacterium (ex Bugula neritina AB1)]
MTRAPALWQCCVTGCLLLLSGLSQASWSSRVEAGVQTDSTGGTVVRLHLHRQDDPVTRNAQLSWNEGSTGDKHRIQYYQRHSISQSFYSFGNISFGREDVDSIKRSLSVTLGGGNQVFRSRTGSIVIEAGTSANQLTRDRIDDDPNVSFYLGSRFNRQFSQLQLSLTTKLRLGNRQNILDSEAALSYQTGTDTAIKIAYQHKKYNFHDSSDKVSDDKSFLTFIYKF